MQNTPSCTIQSYIQKWWIQELLSLTKITKNNFNPVLQQDDPKFLGAGKDERKPSLGCSLRHTTLCNVKPRQL